MLDALGGQTKASTQRHVDVAVITVIKEELIAAKIAFGIENVREDYRSHGNRYWQTTTKDTGGNELKIVITMVGEARNLPCATACECLFASYDVDLCILVGIAAGLESKVSLGDAVSAKLVLDYEGARMEPKRRQMRPLPYSLENDISRDLYHFNPNQVWFEHLERSLNKLKSLEDLPVDMSSWRPKHKMGVILSGEKLLADGQLPNMQKQYHEEVLALEMEGSGFAKVCKEHKIPWLIFRGVSDFGNPKKTFLENWKTTAALSAATAAITFLQTDYRPDTF